MTTSEMPMFTVPATEEAAATLADWLIRSLLPTVLDGTGMVDAADELCELTPITARRIARPRRLRSHERQLRRIIALLEDRLRHTRTAAAEVSLVPDSQVSPIPDEIFDVTAHIGGTIADFGSTAAALANRALFLGAIVVDAGLGANTAVNLRAQITGSYYSLLAYLWQEGLERQLHPKILR